jgi:hypothetical protein
MIVVCLDLTLHKDYSISLRPVDFVDAMWIEDHDTEFSEAHNTWWDSWCGRAFVVDKPDDLRSMRYDLIECLREHFPDVRFAVSIHMPVTRTTTEMVTVR